MIKMIHDSRGVHDGTRRTVRQFFARIVLVSACFLLGSSSTAPRPNIVDAMPSFWKAWNLSEAAPGKRVKQFRQLVIQPNRSVYDFTEFSQDLSSDKNVAAYLTRVKPYIATMRRVSTRLHRELPTDISTVVDQLPGISLDEFHFT